MPQSPITDDADVPRVLSDVQLLSSLLSRSGVAKPLRRAARTFDAGTLHEAISHQLRKPRQKWLRQATGSEWQPWKAVASDSREATAEFVQLAHDSTSRLSVRRKASNGVSGKITRRFSESIGACDLIQSPLEVLACAELWLSTLPGLEPEISLKALRLLFHARELAASETDSDVADQAPLTVEKWVTEFELPWTVAVLLDPLESSSREVRERTKRLSKALLASTDTDGLPAAHLVRRMSDWLSSITRALRWGKLFDVAPWTRSGQKRFEASIEQAALLMSPDGRFVIERDASNETRFGATRLLQDALRFTRLGKRHATTAYVETVSSDAERSRARKRPSKKKVKAALKQRSSWDETNVSNYSDWSEVAILRSSLHRHSDTLCIAFDQPEPALTFHPLGSALMNGNWNIRCSGESGSLPCPDEWNCSSWFDDDEVTYVEFESSPQDSVCYTRQVLLSKDDQFAILCDSVSVPGQEVFELNSAIPLVPGIDVETDVDTRQVYLCADWQRTRAIPMWLSDSRYEAAEGFLTGGNGELKLGTSGVGGAAMPLLLDWNPDRIAAEVDWRRLTVTEDRKLLQSGDASGFRARVGELNLLVFRSLREGEELRALLGLHTGSESVYARIDKDGEVDPLVLVDSH